MERALELVDLGGSDIGMTDTLSSDAIEDEISLTPGAVRQARAMMQRQGSPEQLYLRVGVMGGGCSGFSYAVRLDSAVDESDRIFEFGGVRVAVDGKSLRLLAGAVLDYDTTNLLEGGFKFRNPNARRTCGCGTSFQL
jgi:iron-sulfur cluster assembly protein